ncbi:MAG TPA: PQQ-binding-like beta-propeller repeat protein [Thermoanaerobaculia bacterium]|nr:PQQ-binding-like beta-propeller repeat protein [Thermoanaerobaculia bacterium]
MTQRPRFFPIALAILCSGSPIFADDWPQWRGPARDGRSAETGLAAQWPEAGPPLVLRASGLGGGFSSLAVAGGRIYTLGDQEDGQYLLALSQAEGKVVWKTKVGPVWHDEYGGSRSTPTVDGDRLYLTTTEGRVICLEAAGGKEIWAKSLPQDFGGSMMEINGTHWKFAESPLVDGDRVVVTPGSKTAALVALDKKTGEPVWRTALPESLGEKGADGAAYSSVVISNGAGVKQYVQLIGRGVIGVEAATGRLLWSYNRVANNVANIPTPLVWGDHVFVSTGYGTGAALLELAKADGGVKAREVYFIDAQIFQNHHGNMILHDGHVYAGSGHNKGFPVAVKMTDGALAWGPVRNAGSGSAAVAFADGKVYLRYQNGVMVLMEASPEGYRERGSFKIPDVSAPSWSHPVISGGKLYLREQDNLFVYDLKG